MDQSSQQQLADTLVFHTSHNFQPSASIPRLSQHVQTFIENALSDEVASLLMKPAIRPPTVKGDLPMVDYFISSSHNTYLLSKQVLGRCSSQSYINVLSRGARCVEIDVWPSKNGPIVTHGYTFSQSIPFSDACIAIGSSVQPDSWPVLVSLECHVYGEQNQAELVRIMRDAWGSKFVDRELEGIPKRLPPEMVFGKILVEHYPLLMVNVDEESSSSSSDSESDLEDEQTSDKQSIKRSRIPPQLRISPELAEVGYYFRSMKPSKNWFSRLIPDPPNILLNISESSLLSLLTSSNTILDALIVHGQAHMRRIYPKGLRFTSSNLHPHVFWGSGSHVVALNWQTYDLGMQINEAMFVGTPGWVTKPEWMRTPRGDDDASERRMKIKGKIVGICNCPPPSDRKRTADSKAYDAYVKAQLLLPARSSLSQSSSTLPAVQAFNEVKYESEAQRVQPLTGDLNFAYPTTRTGPIDDAWNNLPWKKKEPKEVLINAEFEWEIWQKWEELTFLRITVCEKEFGKDDTLAIFCARIADIRRAVQEAAEIPASGWRAVRLLDPTGKDCGSVALMQFSFVKL
ncbi:hypothetical protein AGABI1DRAFT_131468 [Agaricus bisporus var. burnettii JB137-S8]|uniref:Phosphoinositide phospholipase C n=1 Tax=Agaricus bisporus var. burnettii (strain JB137-S8 / ATCC MYA-4627 / FGSC 10392) TaxID=597362 RepID=K5XNX9_AGABU|nr:uncharacterized protein AGABI1DRAFT_131468 [Agaricus bisporus var. burnettii JB137-S8]EKM76385.1 hypothetical protein AGABI1DRAFT_131468 [Agaricus bisporus var. burnettii JB137-S8]